MNIFQLLKSLLSRLLFFCHGLICVYLFYGNTSVVEYWAFITPLILLLVEMAYTIGYRKGMEYRYFWPSGFLYIITIIPIIWMIEMQLLDKRIGDVHVQETDQNSTVDKDLKNAAVYLNAFRLNNEVVGKKVCELGLIIGLIAGRWLMPRGNITRDQLSALLLGYVGNAADIIELFETFEDPLIIHERSVTVAVIAVYTWSIFQFTLVTTATIKDKKMLEEDMERAITPKPRKNKIVPTRKISSYEIHSDPTARHNYIEEIKTRKISVSNKENRGRGRKKNSIITPPKIINAQASEQLDEKVRRRAIHGEVFQILVTLLMQDGPFLVLRLYLIIMFSVSSEMHIFFTCKNAIVSILLVYRLCILTCRGEDLETNWHREEASAKLHNVQLAILSNDLRQKTGAIRVQ